MIYNFNIFPIMLYINNPLNLRDSNQDWLGQIESFRGFCQFKDMFYGIRAALITLYNYVRLHEVSNIDNMINRFCPYGDGKNNPDAYVKFVCEYMNKMGCFVFPTTSVAKLNERPVFAFFLLSAMCRMESGLVLQVPEFEKAWNLFLKRNDLFSQCYEKK